MLPSMFDAKLFSFHAIRKKYLVNMVEPAKRKPLCLIYP